MGFLVGDITAGLSSLKAAKDIIQGLSALKTETAVNSAKIELQGLILDAQESLFAAKEANATDASRIADLEQQIIQLKDWTTEKLRYELKRFYPGSLAYVLKPEMATGEPPHRLCTHCYQKGEKSILQATAKTENRYRICHCPSCKTNVAFGEEMPEKAAATLPPDPLPVQRPYDRYRDLEE